VCVASGVPRVRHAHRLGLAIPGIVLPWSHKIRLDRIPHTGLQFKDHTINKRNVKDDYHNVKKSNNGRICREI